MIVFVHSNLRHLIHHEWLNATLFMLLYVPHICIQKSASANRVNQTNNVIKTAFPK